MSNDLSCLKNIPLQPLHSTGNGYLVAALPGKNALVLVTGKVGKVVEPGCRLVLRATVK